MAGSQNGDREQAGAQVGTIRFELEAAAELAEAASWYEARLSGLGRRLLDEVEHLLAVLASRPGAFPRLADTTPNLGLRRALLPRFPFALVFFEAGGEIRVVAVAHARRQPGYWLYRIVGNSK